MEVFVKHDLSTVYLTCEVTHLYSVVRHYCMFDVGWYNDMYSDVQCVCTFAVLETVCRSGQAINLSCFIIQIFIVQMVFYGNISSLTLHASAVVAVCVCVCVGL